MDLSTGDEAWVFDGNILQTGEIIEPTYGGYRFRYTSGYARNGNIDVAIREYLFKIPEERAELMASIGRQEDYLKYTKQDIESGAWL